MLILSFQFYYEFLFFSLNMELWIFLIFEVSVNISHDIVIFSIKHNK